MLTKIRNTLSPYKLAIKLHAFLNLPAMTMKEIKVYKYILDSFKTDEPLDIFEYGSGFSTIYFAKYLKKNNVNFQMDSIDNNLQWHQIVKDKIEMMSLASNVTLHVRDFSPFWDKPGWDWNKEPEKGKFDPKEKNECEYVELPSTLNKKFDLIVIDARFRRRCIENAFKLLKEGGVVFLHDAQKPQYHHPMELYKHRVFIESGHYFPLEKREWKIWVGSDNAQLIEEINEKF